MAGWGKRAKKAGTQVLSNPYYEANPQGSHSDLPDFQGSPFDSKEDYHQKFGAKLGELIWKEQEEFYQKMADLTGVDLPQAQEMTQGIWRFTGDAYSQIRQVDQTGQGTPEALKEIKNINNYLKKMPAYRGAIYRGLAFSSQQEMDSFLKGSAKGTLEIEAISSFSSSRGVADGFTNSGAYRVALVVNQNKSGRSIRSLSKHRFEDEVMVPKGTRYLVRQSSQIGQTVSLELEEF